MRKIFSFSFAALLVLALCAFSAVAQSTTDGAIGGTVKDPNSALVTGATVTIRNEETNKESSTTTDDQGQFRIVGLQPGSYSITIEATGFAKFTQPNVIVEIGRLTPLEVGLGLTGTEGTVTVTAEAPVINTEQQDFSTNINQTSINELPINGRRWSNFALLTPGAVPDGNFGLISFRGISGLLNNSTIDGGDNNQAFFAEERGRTRISYSVSQAAIREFQVNTSSYSAEYGRSAGGVVNAVTKSGTNEFHGGLFYYQRNNKWGARNPLATNNVQVSPGVFDVVGIKPEDVRHQFGGTIGGPIVKDKAFFFFSYDQQKRDFPGLARFAQANFLNLSTANRTLLNQRGLSNTQIDAGLTFLNSLTGEVERTGDQILILPKVDWRLNDDHTLTVTYNRLRWDSPNGIQTQATNTRARDNFGDDFVDIDWVTAKLASTFSSNLLNEFRFQWGRDNEYQLSQPPQAGEPTNSVGGRSPQTFIQNGYTFGIPEFLERVAFPDERRWQFADTMTMTHGKHSLRFGGDINFVKDILNNLRFSGGEFSYSGATGILDFIYDYTNWTTSPGNPALGTVRALNPTAALPNQGVCPRIANATSGLNTSPFRAGQCYAGSFTQGIGPLGLEMETTDVNFFVQDDIRLTPRLNLNLGLRYEYQINPDAINVNPAIPRTANKVSDTNNFGPRIGFAFDMTGDGKTSLRGGWGLYYGRVINSTVYNALINTGLGADRSQQQLAIANNNLPVGCTAQACLPIYPNLLVPIGSTVTNVVVRPAVQFFDEDFQLPQIHQGDLIVEREIGRNTVISASYLFSFGNSLPNFVDINLPPPDRTVSLNIVGGPLNGQQYVTPIFVGNRPNTNFGQITEIRSDINSKYHALVLQANRRLTDGLQFQMNYTLSRAQDNGQASVTFTTGNLPFNAFDQAAETSLSNFDRRQKFVTSLVYNTNFKGLDGAAAHILNGWTIAPILNAFSGARVTGSITGSISPTSFGFASNTTPGGGVNGSGGSNRFAGLPRNHFKQPNIWFVDMRVSRRFNFNEDMNIEVLGEAFNLFNRTQVTGINSTLYAISGNTVTFNAPFGTTTAADSTLFRERQIQLAVRFTF